MPGIFQVTFLIAQERVATGVVDLNLVGVLEMMVTMAPAMMMAPAVVMLPAVLMKPALMM